MKEPYYLTDLETGRRISGPHDMDWEEAAARNKKLEEKDRIRWRWVKSTWELVMT